MARRGFVDIIPLFVICFLAGLNCQETDEDDGAMSGLGTAIASTSPCSSGFITMTRESGRPPSKDNYWSGTFNLDKYKGISEARISLTLDSEAVVTVDGELASIYADGKTFRFATYGIPKVPEELKFEVNAPPNKPFPEVVSATLNGLRVCKNPTPWHPDIQKVADTAVGTVTQSPNDFVPWCGRRRIEHTELVVNGQATKYGDWPWHAALYQFTDNKAGQKYACGASLVSRDAVVTAGHCVTLYGQVISNDLLLVILGKYNLLGRDPGSQEREVSNIVVHPDFNTNPLSGDIAILRLKTQVEFNDYVQPICLWPEDEISKDTIVGQTGTVVGWGLNENDVLSQQLTAGGMPVVTDAECLLSYATFFERFVSDKTFCAGRSNGTSACNGDSGGGLVFSRRQPDNKLSYFLRGLVSVSVARSDKAVCDPKHFIVFTDSAKYLKFIKDNM